ncbi:hypothetical protein CAEBREN_07795 [Caenorhabditis brenneri]|uniref:Malectin domain-containing protein n=1 Tax=Caenorhabditis brenneri TaxID=135651 RepID=G0NB54_CAEBE|nr:hypothetical protein CAEBREN_07795 [Caenorhabditis brenneri]
MGISIHLVLFTLLLFHFDTTFAFNLRDRVVTAVNCGGGEAMGAHGILYSADYLDDGVASDVGRNYRFANSHMGDVAIYQTERWSKESFDYEVPASDGEYVIILKFSEVYFRNPGEKVFNVRINSRTVAENLDIFEESGGLGFAYDLYVPVVIKDKKITINEKSKAYNGKITIEFAKGPHDNPKVNGFVVLRGTIDDLPPPPKKHSLEDLPEEFDIYGNENDMRTMDSQKDRDDELENFVENEEDMFSATTGSENPFEKESVDLLIPVVSALVIIIPIAYVIQIRFAQN